MKTHPLLTAALLLTATLAFLPSAEAELPIYCVMAPCGPGDGPTLPPICGETVNCQGPECPALAFDSYTLLPQLATRVVVTVGSDCSVLIEEAGTPCGSMFDQVEDQHKSVSVVDVEYDSCHFNPDCTCDPLPIELTSTSAAAPPGIQPPPQCFTQSCCFAPCPPPCDGCPTPSPVPRCPDLDVDTTQFLLWAGPSVGAETDSDCSANACLNDADCSDASCSNGVGFCCSVQGTASYCTSVQAVCPEVAVATSQFFAYLGPHAGVALHSDCTLDIWEAGIVCPQQMSEGHIERTIQSVEVSADTCALDLTCTCPPLLSPLDSAAVAFEPPVRVEFVTCVTSPCPPRVICSEREYDAGVVAGAYLEHDCELTVGVIDGARVCATDPLEHHQVRQTVSLVTLVVNYCGTTMT